MVMAGNHKIDTLEADAFLELLQVNRFALVGVPEHGMSAVGDDQVSDAGLPDMPGDLDWLRSGKLHRSGMLQNTKLPIVCVIERGKFHLQGNFPSDWTL